MNIVTKSGTNDFRGSWFTSMRDNSLNAKTQTEKINKLPKGEYRAVSVRRLVRRADPPEQGALLRRLRAHAAGHDAVGQHAGLFPQLDGVFATPKRENLFTAKASANLTPSQYMSVRYGRNTNSQVYGATTRRSRQLGRQHEQVQLDQRQPQLGARRIEAERVRVPVRGLRQPRHGAHGRSAGTSSRTA